MNGHIKIIKLKIALIIIIFAASCAPQGAERIAPETVKLLESQQAVAAWVQTTRETDECSSTEGLHWFAETFLRKNWQDCCIQHDFDYRKGSRYGITRNQADYELWACIGDTGHPVVANIVYTAVHQFGRSSWRKQ
jgi:hypothetical protein